MMKKFKSVFSRLQPMPSRVLQAAALGMLLATAVQAEEASVAITEDVPAGLVETAEKLRPALFFVLLQAGDKVVPQVGFFIDDKGMALCPLDPLHAKPVPVFRVGEGKSEVLKSPVVLEVFPDQGLALVKFDHKPAASLKISGETPVVGTWLAVVPSGNTRGGSLAGAIAAPIVAHRITHNVSLTNPPHPPQKQFSMGVGNSPASQLVLRAGAPIINGRGEVVATFAGAQAMPGQTLQLAHSLAGFPAMMEVALKKPPPRKLPLASEDLGLDPAILSDEYLLMGMSAVTGDLAKARQLARKLVEKFPNSMIARSSEFGFATQQVLSGQAQADGLVEIAKRSLPPEPSTALDQAAYHERMGQALMQEGRLDEAMASLRKSHELDSRAMACITLAPLHEKRGELEQAEHYWRLATTLDADRIGFWDRYQHVLTARGKWKEADAAQDRIFLLENLYRSR
jgi:hypothetical protein